MWFSNKYIHETTELHKCAAHAFILASFFVLNLYVLVPKSIRQLSRNNTKQIKWRIVSVLTTVTGSLVIYPCIFCQNGDDQNNTESSKSLGHLLGLWNISFQPLIHGMTLYTGAVVITLLQHRLGYVLELRNATNRKSSYSKQCLEDMRQNISIFPINWIQVRDLIIAPFAEEVIFRACIVTPFLYSLSHANGSLSRHTISWVTPLFFGVAHFHHALRRLKDENCSVPVVLLSSAFQFTYTTIFGAYASFCYIKYHSLLGVVMLHSFCNYMGLPQLGFFFLDGVLLDVPNLKVYKFLGFLAYAVGIVYFYFSFQK